MAWQTEEGLPGSGRNSKLTGNPQSRQLWTYLLFFIKVTECWFWTELSLSIMTWRSGHSLSSMIWSKFSMNKFRNSCEIHELRSFEISSLQPWLQSMTRMNNRFSFISVINRQCWIYTTWKNICTRNVKRIISPVKDTVPSIFSNHRFDRNRFQNRTCADKKIRTEHSVNRNIAVECAMYVQELSM